MTDVPTVPTGHEHGVVMVLLWVQLIIGSIGIGAVLVTLSNAYLDRRTLSKYHINSANYVLNTSDLIDESLRACVHIGIVTIALAMLITDTHPPTWWAGTMWVLVSLATDGMTLNRWHTRQRVRALLPEPPDPAEAEHPLRPNR